MSESDHSPEQEGKPPIFKSWSTLYWLVIGNLAFLIILFYIFSKTYS